MTSTEGLQAVEGHINTYHVRSTDEGVLACCRANPIVFSTEDAIPLPNPAYLAIHAACCRVAHLSGAADYIDETYNPDDEGKSARGAALSIKTWVDLIFLSPSLLYIFIYLLVLLPTIRGLLIYTRNLVRNVAPAPN